MNQSGRSISFKILQLVRFLGHIAYIHRFINILCTLPCPIACIAALIFKKITDNKAQMLLKLNQKASNEWNLLQNVSWSKEGSDFAIFVYAGFTFIISVCLLDRMVNYKKALTTTDTFFLRFGVLIFFVQGIMVFYSIEYVQDDLRINALILGSLTLSVGFLFFLEDCLITKKDGTSSKIVQTEKIKPLSSIPVKQTYNNILHTYV